MNDPQVTVIMPIRNEQAFMARSLGAVLAQDYPADLLQIVVADGMSDDNTLNVIAALPDSWRVTVVTNHRRIQAAGLNEALRVATGSVIIRVDGHTIIAHDYVRTCVELLQQTGAANVGGRMAAVGLTPVGSAIADALTSAFAVPGAFHTSNRQQVTDTVYLGAWPRAVLERLGGFNETVGVNEDYELNYRLRQSGGVILFSPLLHSDYYGRQTLGALAQQYWFYGVSKVRVLRLYPRSLRWRQLAAPGLVLALAGGAALWIISPAPALIVLGVYFTINGVFGWRVSRRTGSRIALLLLIFPVIHLAWGAGFLAGLFTPGHFWSR